MPSSTSNSDARLPCGPWGRTWIAGLLLAIAALGAYEGFWRSRGFVPSLNDDQSLWIATRKRVRSYDRDQVVIIGNSREQYGVDPVVLGQSLGGPEPLLLAINGTPSLPILRDFGEDKRFCGVVICDLSEQHFFAEPPLENLSATYAEASRKQRFVEAIDGWVAEYLQSKLVLRMPDVEPSWVALVARHGLPRPSPFRMLPNRHLLLDPDRGDRTAAMRDRVEHLRTEGSELEPDLIDQRCELIASFVRPIQARGGRVIFVRMPLTGEYADIVERRWPRKIYFDVFARHHIAPIIDSSSEPTFNRLECFDGSHLDQQSAILFTRELGRLLKERRYLQPP